MLRSNYWWADFDCYFPRDPPCCPWCRDWLLPSPLRQADIEWAPQFRSQVPMARTICVCGPRWAPSRERRTATVMTLLIQAANIDYAYGGNEVLNGASFEIR